MSKINKFLNKSAIISGFVAMSLVAIAFTASAQNHGKNRPVIVNNNDNFVVNKPGSRGRLSLNRVMGGRQIGYNNRNRKAFRPNARANNRAYNRGFHHARRNNDGAFLGGLFTGAVISSAFNNRRHYNTHVGINYSFGHPGFGYGYPGYRFAPRTNVVYVERPVQTAVKQVPVYAQGPNYQQQQPGYYQYQPTQQQAVNNSCLQTREYTTTIEIGSEAVPAYGQACLQPDGSWKFGDPVAVPSF